MAAAGGSWKNGGFVAKGGSDARSRAIDARLGEISSELNQLRMPKFPGTPEYERYQRLTAENRALSDELIGRLRGV